MTFFEVVGAIVVALGVTEVTKKYLLSFATDYLNRNKEIRKIGTRVQKHIVTLLDEQFKNPITGKDKSTLLLDVLRMDGDDDKEFTTGIMQLINLPVQLKTYNPQRNSEEARMAVEETRKLYDVTTKLNKLCNYYRHYPLIRFSKPSRTKERE